MQHQLHFRHTVNPANPAKRFAKLRGAAVALVRILRHRAIEDRGEFRTHRQVDFICRSEQTRFGAHQGGSSRQRIRRFDAGEQMIERRPERVDVALRRRTEILNLLQRSITRRIAKNAGARCGVGRIRNLYLCQTKIEQNDFAHRGNFEIVRLDITMNDLPFARMQIDERVQ